MRATKEEHTHRNRIYKFILEKRNVKERMIWKEKNEKLNEHVRTSSKAEVVTLVAKSMV